MTRWKLTIEYDGGPFMGWQRQDHGPSVQQTLEEALHRMTGELATVTAAGRTDAGVHALAMSAHVDLARTLTPHRLREGLNALVRPHPVSVLDVEKVADTIPVIVHEVESRCIRHLSSRLPAPWAGPPHPTQEPGIELAQTTQ